MLTDRCPGPWCSGQTCQPVTLEIAGSNPVGPASPLVLVWRYHAPGDGYRHGMARVAIFGLTLLLLISLAGCQQPGTISTGPDGLRTFATDPNVLCNLGRYLPGESAVLAGDPNDPERVWLVGANVAPSKPRVSVIWPQGFHVRFEPDAVLYNEKDVAVARQGETVAFPQANNSEHAGTYADPYLASGIIFNGCYPV